MLKWSQLLNPKRRNELRGTTESINTAVGREELERDYDRILFATPTRRLADKTQVFPMEDNDAIRNRLTHSFEVSNLARSIGIRLAFNHAEDVFGPEHEDLRVQRTVPALLAAVGLAHDLGNPPFGHQGELAIREWFVENHAQYEFPKDLLHFDGNPQTFRLLTRLQVLNDEFGYNLTVATLAALLKYPHFFSPTSNGSFRKFGIFESERSIVQEVWDETGLEEGIRHPCAYIMEACDDIVYSVVDAEDTVKKGYASFYDLMDFLDSSNGTDETIRDTIRASRKKNAEFKRESLSSRELNDISMQMFRTKAISLMVMHATETFVSRIDDIMDGSVPADFELIHFSKSCDLCSALKKFDKRHGFTHSEVLELELVGSNYIRGLMDLLWPAIYKQKGQRDAYERYAYGRISENYRRVYESSTDRSEYGPRLLSDTVSGMTEKYLINMHQKLRDLRNGPQ